MEIYQKAMYLISDLILRRDYRQAVNSSIYADQILRHHV